MTGIAYARGQHAWFTCDKCGLRFKYSEIRNDGFFRNLRVCGDCVDSRQPQERLLRVADPTAIWRGTPDTIHAPTEVLLADPVLVGADLQLSWSPSTSQDSGVAGYLVLRAVGADDLTQIADLPVTRDFIATITNEPLSYVDVSPGPGVYSYAVMAYDLRNPALHSGSSNIVAVTVT